jgi:hypothetical protein
VRARPVWVLAALSAVCALGDTVVVAGFQPLLSERSIALHGWPLVPAASLGSAIMGAIIVSRYPRQPIGWLLAVIGTTTSVSILCEAYSIWSTEEGGPGSEGLGQLAGLVAALLGGPLALAGLAVMFLLAPDGHVLSRRWRWAVAAPVVGLALFWIGVANTPLDDLAGRAEPENATATVAFFSTTGVLIITGALVTAVVAMVLRLRRATGETRQQLRWVLASAVFVALGLSALIVAQGLNGGRQTWASAVPLQVSFLLLPICLAVAVLRYRLYDVELIINRAIVLGLATLFVAVGYIALVVGVGALLGGQVEHYWPSVVATAVIAIAFQPLRRSVVRFADRLAYGARAAPYDALSDFSRRLGESPAPEALLPAVAEAVGRAVSAHEVRVMLDVEHGSPPTAVWAPEGVEAVAVDEEALVMVPIADRAGRLGELSVRLRPGRSARPQEVALVADIAEQAALAFRNNRLQAELAAHVAQLDERTDQLEASRRRLFEAGDAERRRLEAAIARDVMPSLHSLTTALDEARQGDPSSDRVGPLVDQATGALDALRDLTRGIFPTMLTRTGLGPALSSYLGRLGRPDALVVAESVAGRRFAARTEAAAYFCCTAAVPDRTGTAQVSLAVSEDTLAIEIAGAAHTDADLAAMVDRVEALGGSLRLSGDITGDGQDSLLLVRLPVDAERRTSSRTR